MQDGDSGRDDGALSAERVVRVPNRLGLHARPAAEFVKLSSRFASQVTVEKEGLEVNGKSIMGVMMLAAEYDSELRIRAVGKDSEEAVAALADLVTSGFGEHASDYSEPGDGKAARA